MEEENLEKDMTPVLRKDLGMRYPTEISKEKKRYGLYRCQYCGKEFEAIIINIKNGHTKSCGCQSTKYKNPHGLSYHPLYDIWSMMKARCYNHKAQYYNDYGARGIQVCERWLDIRNFVEDMYPFYEDGLSLDRIDVNGNYEPDNCRWASNQVQGRNTRDICRGNTSGYRGVYLHQRSGKWHSNIKVNNKRLYLGSYQTALEAAKAYERYVRLNNLEHNYTPALTEEEVGELYKLK